MLGGTNGMIIVIAVAFFLIVVSVAVIKKVFFTAKAAPTATPVVAYHNKAMA